jgi:ribosomal protein S18 acetylase RimI-like enzyme
MDERIETFKVEHLDDCAHLFMIAFNAEPWNDKYTLDTAKKQLAWHLRVPGCVGLVSVKDGIVAFAIGYREPTDVGDVFHLSIFCVRPDAQRTGVGSRLLLHLEERLRDTGIRTVYLGTRKGTPAEAFYEKNAYGASAEDIEMSHDLRNSERG